jgi:glucoamylase
MEEQAGYGGFFSEQVWDTSDLPERELFSGRPSGSAMPLVWAHAEYIKLRRSLRDGRVFDLPPQTVQRYQVQQIVAEHFCWRFGQKSRSFPAGKLLRVETLAPARVQWSTDGWVTIHDTDTQDTGLGIHFADLPTSELLIGTEITFTFYWPQTARWEGNDFAVQVS